MRAGPSSKAMAPWKNKRQALWRPVGKQREAERSRLHFDSQSTEPSEGSRSVADDSDCAASERGSTLSRSGSGTPTSSSTSPAGFGLWSSPSAWVETGSKKPSPAARHTAVREDNSGEWKQWKIWKSGHSRMSDNGWKQSQRPEANCKVSLPASSPNSWAAAQRLRQISSKECQGVGGTESADRQVELGRRFKSILNKVTPEKFDSLCIQLAESGVLEANVEQIAKILYDETVVHQKFTPLLADLTVRIMEDLKDKGWELVIALFQHCERGFTVALDQGSKPTDTDEAAVQKVRALGNILFMAELFVRQIFAPEHILVCTTELLRRPGDLYNSELLVALLKVVGPPCDNTAWALHLQFEMVFREIRGLTCDVSLPKRTRFLFTDLLEMRDAGWSNSACKQTARPQLLQQDMMAMQSADVPFDPSVCYAVGPTDNVTPMAPWHADADWMCTSATYYGYEAFEGEYAMSSASGEMYATQIVEWPTLVGSGACSSMC